MTDFQKTVVVNIGKYGDEEIWDADSYEIGTSGELDVLDGGVCVITYAGGYWKTVFIHRSDEEKAVLKAAYRESQEGSGDVGQNDNGR